MIPSPQAQAVALWAARVGISNVGMVAFALLRLSWLRSRDLLPPQARAVYAPQGGRSPTRARLGRAYRIMASGDHRRIDDLWLSALVYAARWLFLLGLILMIVDGYVSHKWPPQAG